MIGLVSISGHTTYGLREFVLDTAADLTDLPVEGIMGSKAFVIATSQKYMLNSTGTWVEITA